MKAYFKKIAALTAAALLVLSMAACGGDDDAETTTSPVDNSDAVVETDNVPADDTDASEEESNSEGDTAASTPATPGSVDDTKPSAGPSSSDTLSKEEAVALFNKATAAAKSKSGVRSTAVNIDKLPGGMDKLKGFISNMLKDSTSDVAISGVPNAAMNASDFSSVKVEKSGSNWKLTMAVKGETAPNHAANSRAFAELPQKDIDEWLNDKLSVKPADSIKFDYSGGTIVATVSPDGKLISGTYTMKVTVNVNNAKAMGIFTISTAKVTVVQTDKF